MHIIKNRPKLRRMKINDKEYLRNYYYNDMEFSKYPYSYYLFVPKHNERLKVRVYFTKYEPEMRLGVEGYEGTVCYYKGEECVLNLCRPYFARKVIEYIFDNCCAETDIGEIEIKNGEEILEKLGYSDFYNDIWEKVNESARTDNN